MPMSKVVRVDFFERLLIIIPCESTLKFKYLI